VLVYATILLSNLALLGALVGYICSFDSYS